MDAACAEAGPAGGEAGLADWIDGHLWRSKKGRRRPNVSLRLANSDKNQHAVYFAN